MEMKLTKDVEAGRGKDIAITLKNDLEMNGMRAV
jgi:hypothetical protein